MSLRATVRYNGEMRNCGAGDMTELDDYDESRNGRKAD